MGNIAHFIPHLKHLLFCEISCKYNPFELSMDLARYTQSGYMSKHVNNYLHATFMHNTLPSNIAVKTKKIIPMQQTWYNSIFTRNIVEALFFPWKEKQIKQEWVGEKCMQFLNWNYIPTLFISLGNRPLLTYMRRQYLIVMCTFHRNFYWWVAWNDQTILKLQNRKWRWKILFHDGKKTAALNFPNILLVLAILLVFAWIEYVWLVLWAV